MRKAIQRRSLQPPWQPHRERLGEWAVTAVIVLVAALWLLWPQAPQGTAPGRAAARLPEAGAAFVNLVASGSPLRTRPDRSAHGGADPSALLATLSLTPAPPVPPVPAAPPYRDLALPPRPPLPASLAVPPLPLCIAERPDFTPPPAPAAPPRLHLSPALVAAGFDFVPPHLEGTNSPGRTHCAIELDAAGAVAHLLLLEAANPAAARPLLDAISRAHGTTNASGHLTFDP